MATTSGASAVSDLEKWGHDESTASDTCSSYGADGGVGVVDRYLERVVLA